MKKFFLILIAVFLFLFQEAKAQENDNNFLSKGTYMFTFSPSLGFASNTVYYGVNVSINRFMFDKFSVGLEIGSSFSSNSNKAFSFKPNVRYYFLKRKLSPFISTGYNFSFTKNYNIEGFATYSSPFIGAGLLLTFGKRRFGIELSGEYSFGKNGGFMPQLGFVFFLNSKNKDKQALINAGYILEE